MKLIPVLLTILLLTGIACGQSALEQQFPEAPQPVKPLRYGGYEVDRSKIVKDPRTLTKTFIIAHSAYLAANVFDIEMTHQGVAHHKCVEGGFDGDRHPSRGEMYATDMGIFAALTTFDWLFAKAQPPKAFKWMPLMGATWGTTVHLKGGIDWYNRCW